jgi:hypothetical protein
MTPRKKMIFEVLDAAKDACDAEIVAACRRLMKADRLGWRKYADISDWAKIEAFAAE